ncbi:DUF438 domain-containing protein [Prevotella sp. A2931]|uniref:DUF438 domain-containing protein n=1 Tax=Prevotella illustrans TaxID=2800387 RepID=A0ABS3M4S0_9BACT|nr:MULTISPECIES: DUF438 domain-containing protein [Prevotella]MBO1363177.1 DUF438 domain-containing protein [Prevotella illustrans]PTL25352.1 DUF438 domain-containing protein [Prevotella sp. oral taxon 820]
MAKKIDFSKTVFELTREYPELVDIMAALGFTEIKKKVMLRSVGKIMTIPKGAQMKGISMVDIIKSLQEHGFEISGVGPTPKTTIYNKVEKAKPLVGKISYDHAKAEAKGRIGLLKSYLQRLSNGEDLEQVRADFIANFNEVEAAEIMQAEQELMKEGVPLREVQRLCDVHSALFHGNTHEEKIAGNQDIDRANSLEHTEGHPLQTLYRENEALVRLANQALERQQAGEDIGEDIGRIRAIAIHYAKKGDLLYPHLKVKYDITGPSQVMWTVDDEIRDELGRLSREVKHDEQWNRRAKEVLTRALEMTYKENNILFPLCAANFTENEWIQIYHDGKDYAECLGVERTVWQQAENTHSRKMQQEQGKVVMPGGTLTLEQLTAMLNTLPMEITFVDAGNINRYFSEGPKVFKRPLMALGREVFTCHPPKIETMVRAIIDDFRTGKRVRFPVWMEKNGRSMLVNYMAVRDHDGNYLGTVEIVQDMEFAKEHFLGKE